MTDPEPGREHLNSVAKRAWQELDGSGRGHNFKVAREDARDVGIVFEDVSILGRQRIGQHPRIGDQTLAGPERMNQETARVITVQVRERNHVDRVEIDAGMGDIAHPDIGITGVE